MHLRVWQGRDISEYLKDCTCMKSLVDDLVVTWDEIVDTPDTSDKIIGLFLLFNQQLYVYCCWRSSLLSIV